MSRVALYDHTGGPEVLRLAEQPDREPGTDEALIEVHVAGLNPFDRKVRAGIVPLAAPFPRRIGSDLAGTVLAAGAEARYADGSPVRPGDAVLGWAEGSVAERVTAPASALTPRPEALPEPVAGGLAVAGLTAVASLRTVPLGPDDTVLLAAAAGAVGIVYAQLAIARGARVIGTASPRHHDFLRSLGVEPIGYGDGLLERVSALVPAGPTAVQDNHGHDAMYVGIALGVPRGRICGIADHTAVARLGATSPPRGERSVADLARLAAEIAAGRLVLPVAAAFELDRVVEAFTALETPHDPGKIVVTAGATAAGG
ncbi:MAG: NADP-dependent oxidoreductase [Microbacteriaceae bacterium]